jgi:hypothetical protein
VTVSPDKEKLAVWPYTLRAVANIGYYDIVLLMRTILLKILPFGICLLATGILADALPLQQQAQSFTITLQGSVAEITPLFGPVREQEWAPDWAPHFIYPAQGGQEEGAVFTTTSANGQECRAR